MLLFCFFLCINKCLKCIEAISGVIVKACLNSYCVNVTGVVNMSTDGVRVMATFNNLKENRKYTATVQVQYNEGVIQQSQPVEISEQCNLCDRFSCVEY